MADLDDIRRLVPGDNGLCTVSRALDAGTVHSSVVNGGVLDHPASGDPVVGFVVRGDSRKLRLLRSDPRVTVSFRVGWDWAAVAGTADIIGPDDGHDGVDPDRVPELLRQVFAAAGGTHDDWDEYDRVMAAERRTAVLVNPRRFFGRG